MSERTGPRTADLPMAFTPWEFARGALITYALFLGFTAVVWFWLSPIIGIIGALWAAPFALIALVLVGSPLALLAGVLLRRHRETLAHLVTHGVVGLVSGCAGIVIFLSLTAETSIYEYRAPHAPDWTQLDGVWWVAPIEVLITSAAAMVGWRITSRKALNADSPRDLAASQDADAAFEDAATSVGG